MSSTAHPMQILVVDDSPVYRKLIQHVLESEPYELFFAKSGEEALALYAKHSPQLIITDWMMPDISGLELCRRVRADTARPHAHIILLTSISEKDSVVQALSAGADDYLTKPFDPGELLARVGVGCRTIGLHREIDAKNKQLEHMAHSDPLTSLPNRRAIDEWAARQLRGAIRHGFPFWLVLVDLDSFKSVNDTHGHHGGDAVLEQFSEILRANTRASDICGRLGGDEFLLVVTHVGAESIVPTVERFREQLAAKTFTIGASEVHVTASFGIAGVRGKENIDFGGLMRRADEALYTAKRGGRNKVGFDA